MIHLHLFSAAGERDIRNIVEASRVYLENRTDAMVAYLPMASLAHSWQESTEKAFRNLARVETVNTEMMELSEMESVLRRADLIYVPGGNTFLLNHRLHTSHLVPYLSKKVVAGLPLVAFSAGVMICGPNILTSNDLNMVGTPHFSGLNVTPFNFNVHYHGDLEIDNRMVDYHIFHDNPIILLEDTAYLKVEGKSACLVRGEAWILRKGLEKERLESGVKFSS